VIATRRRRRSLERLTAGTVASAPTTPTHAPFAVIGRCVPVPRAARASLMESARAAGVGFDDLAGRKAVGAGSGILAAIVLTRLPATVAAAPLLAAGGWRAPEVLLARRARERDDGARVALPDALDLLAACALAGMSIDGALRTVAPDVEGSLGDALRETVRALDMGMPRRAAYRVLAERAPIPDVRSLVRALERAERYGTPLAATLVAQAREVRGRRRVAAEEAARAAPVRMLFPLVVCFLPAFVLLSVAPVVLTALRSFRGGG
jgi:tight adherence protein C